MARSLSQPGLFPFMAGMCNHDVSIERGLWSVDGCRSNIRGNITKLNATQKDRYRTVKYMLPLPHVQAAMLVSASALQFRRTFSARKGQSKDWNDGMRLFTFTYTWRAPCIS